MHNAIGKKKKLFVKFSVPVFHNWFKVCILFFSNSFGDPVVAETSNKIQSSPQARESVVSSAKTSVTDSSVRQRQGPRWVAGYTYSLGSWPSGKLPFDCQKIAKNFTFFSKKLTKIFIFFNKIAIGNFVLKKQLFLSIFFF